MAVDQRPKPPSREEIRATSKSMTQMAIVDQAKTRINAMYVSPHNDCLVNLASIRTTTLCSLFLIACRKHDQTEEPALTAFVNDE